MKPDLSSHDIVKGYWQSQNKSGDFDSLWQKSLHDGWVAGTAVAEVNASGLSRRCRHLPPSPVSGVEVVFRPDPTIGDGALLE